MPRLCIVCGARVRNQNPKTNTCDSTCTKAKHNHLTRWEQIQTEMKREDYIALVDGYQEVFEVTDEPRVRRKIRL